eukprot:TRINITY_DN9398_c0_g1_i2.p1 TRINITY_DN9398_c0_g1~~TRINITY_DN9398_c0_g1_i2.p1  ORF type:complete len:119 (-),score=11.12 TRINITY_DN9398_c0_g1_i2:54-410(-)
MCLLRMPLVGSCFMPTTFYYSQKALRHFLLSFLSCPLLIHVVHTTQRPDTAEFDVVAQDEGDSGGFELLPDEIVELIMLRLPLPAVVAVGACCSRLRHLAAPGPPRRWTLLVPARTAA